MKKQIKISEVLAMLQEGKTREDIAEHYGISMVDCKKLFKHEKLKGKKTIKQPDFELVDDTEEKSDLIFVNEQKEGIELSNPVEEKQEESTPSWDN